MRGVSFTYWNTNTLVEESPRNKIRSVNLSETPLQRIRWCPNFPEFRTKCGTCRFFVDETPSLSFLRHFPPLFPLFVYTSEGTAGIPILGTQGRRRQWPSLAPIRHCRKVGATPAPNACRRPPSPAGSPAMKPPGLPHLLRSRPHTVIQVPHHENNPWVCRQFSRQLPRWNLWMSSTRRRRFASGTGSLRSGRQPDGSQ